MSLYTHVLHFRSTAGFQTVQQEETRLSMKVPRSALELLQEMVGFDTANRTALGEPFAERQLAERLEELAVHWKLTVERLPVADDAYNLLVTAACSTPLGDDAPWLLFDSHLDTVAFEGMTVDPLAGEMRDGCIYGRGACDTKGSGAAMLWALKTLQQRGELQQNVAILFSIDEEVTRTGLRAFVHRQLDNLPWRPAAAIVGEPTELQMVTAHNGLVRWQIVTRGKACHSSDPTQGRSAIRDMARVIALLEDEYIPGVEACHPMTGRAACSINLIHGGQQINMIPDECTIAIDRRLVPGEDGATVLPAVETMLNRLRDDDPALEVMQQTPRIENGLAPETNGELAKRVAARLAQLGLSETPVGAKYGSHASTFAEAGIPSLVLGPGNIDQAHSKDEYLELEQLEAAVDAYQTLMREPLTGDVSRRLP